MFKWARRKADDASGYAKGLVNAEELKDNLDEIKNMANVVLNPKNASKQGKVETFEEAKQRLKLSQEDLKSTYYNFTWMFYIYFIFAIMCYFGVVYYLFFAPAKLPALSFFGIGCFLTAASFKYSFRAFQIKHQKLCSISDWLERKNEWFPKF